MEMKITGKGGYAEEREARALFDGKVLTVGPWLGSTLIPIGNTRSRPSIGRIEPQAVAAGAFGRVIACS
ncbi:hypothetical protein VTN49DRAFT_7525 [Thermomyces lanuginosus]|uniref:uncharacterized protein n=1 Tax=Thermomyces lanuginosus TaxID=5541 RepID=UPI0037437A6D